MAGERGEKRDAIGCILIYDFLFCFSQVQLQNLMTSKYIEHFLEEVSAWQNKLSIADQVITLWLVMVE